MNLPDWLLVLLGVISVLTVVAIADQLLRMLLRLIARWWE